MENNTQVQTQAPKTVTIQAKLSGFSANLEKYESTVASLLGEKYGITAKEFTVSVMNAIKKNPKLLDCDQKSLFGAILLSAELKLKPNTPEGFAYIIPYGKEAQFQIGYKGLIEIAYRSPLVKGIKGVAVFANEFYEEMQDGTFKHIPYTGMDLNIMQLIEARKDVLFKLGKDGSEVELDLKAYSERLKQGKGEVVLAYAVCYIDGLDMPVWASVTKDVLAKIKGLSQSGGSSYSPYNSGNDVHNSMQFKAAIKKLFKFLPKQDKSEFARAIEVDDKAMAGSIAIANDDGTIDIIDINAEDVTNTDSKEAANKKLESLKAGEQTSIPVEA